MQNKNQRHVFNGPLRVHPTNPRYFTDNSGKAIYLTGSHTWESLQDQLYGEKTRFDYDYYIKFMEDNNHNFMRMWIWEQGAWMPGTEDKVIVDPLPYQRTGPGESLDGQLKFNLDRWNEAFFERLRSRVIEAGKKGIYVSVMLFEGWSIRKPWVPGDPWKGHPFYADNNINGVNGDLDGDGVADIHCLDIPAVVHYQEAFVKKVIDTVNDLDNVLYEIINEGPGEDRTIDWQIHFINFIHEYEATKPKQHPVGMTPTGNMAEKTVLFTGPADWISPTYIFEPAYRTDPPAADGRKVILNDVDHLEPQLAIEYKWVWMSFLRGLHPIFMDPWEEPVFIGESTSTPKFRMRVRLIRQNMGYSLRYAERIDLAFMVPRNDLASTRYCLANPGSEYLVYLADSRTVEVDLSGTAGTFEVEWFDPIEGETAASEAVSGGGKVCLTAPLFAGDAVLYLYRAR